MLAINGEERRRSHSSTLKSARVLIESPAFRPIRAADKGSLGFGQQRDLAHQSPPNFEAIERDVPCQLERREFQENIAAPIRSVAASYF
jgi:hypothetical protein